MKSVSQTGICMHAGHLGDSEQGLLAVTLPQMSTSLVTGSLKHWLITVCFCFVLILGIHCSTI